MVKDKKVNNKSTFATAPSGAGAKALSVGNDF